MDLKALRALFPHTEHGCYLNHAATGPISKPVLEALDTYLGERNRTNVENFFDYLPLLEETRGRLAQLIGTTYERVEFMPNTSYALNTLALGLDWQPGDRVAVPGCEFPANVYPFLNLADRGVAVDFIPAPEGTFSLADVEAALTPQTRVLSVSWVQFLSGFRADVAALGALCRSRGIWFCVDAIQGLGALPLDVAAAQVDFLACGGHKWMLGTQGLGFLFLTEALQAALRPPMAGWLHGPIDWEKLTAYQLNFFEDAARFRIGTINTMGAIALHAAAGLHLKVGKPWAEAQVLARAGQLAAGLEQLGLRRYGSPDPQHASGIVTVEAEAPERLYEGLKAAGVQAALRNRKLRFSPHYYNSAAEIDQALDAVAAVLQARVTR